MHDEDVWPYSIPTNVPQELKWLGQLLAWPTPPLNTTLLRVLSPDSSLLLTHSEVVVNAGSIHIRFVEPPGLQSAVPDSCV